MAGSARATDRIFRPAPDSPVAAGTQPHLLAAASIAFSRGVDSTDGASTGALFLVGADGRGQRRLVSGAGRRPSWAPDGSRLAYQGTVDTSNYGAIPALKVVVPGASPKTLGPIHEEFAFQDAAWSPDDKWLAFEYVEDPGGKDETHVIAVIRPDGSGFKVLTHLGSDGFLVEGAYDYSPAWSPRSDAIVYSSGSIEIVSVTGGPSRVVAKANLALNAPSWSPRGTKIAFVGEKGIEVVAPDGSGRKLIAPARQAGNPAWSPRGRTIAFDAPGPGGRGIYQVNPDGSGVRRVTPRGLVSSEPAWSPDGRRIAFAAGGIWVMHADGAARTRLTRGADLEPAWRPQR